MLSPTWAGIATDTSELIAFVDIEVRRRHDWVAITTYDLSEAQAKASESDVPVLLTQQMTRSTIGPICFNCERPYSEADSSCPGGDPIRKVPRT